MTTTTPAPAFLDNTIKVVLPAGGLGWSEVIVMPHADPNRERANC
jgi:hypothetical protein